MAKIGTAHIELKPVLDEAALDAISKRIEGAVAEGVRLGMEKSTQASTFVINASGPFSELAAADAIARQRQRAEVRNDLTRH